MKEKWIIATSFIHKKICRKKLNDYNKDVSKWIVADYIHQLSKWDLN